MKKTILLTIACVASSFVFAQNIGGIDGLGRKIPQQSEVGNLQSDKKIAIFYFLWQGDPSSPTSENVYDLTKLWNSSPKTFEDFNDNGWGGGAGRAGKYYYWGEPVWGYYSGTDYWVHLKNVQLLTDAGIDILVIDATNRLTYPRQTKALLEALKFIRMQQGKAPKLVFYTNSSSGEGMQELYNNVYKEGAELRDPDAWYYLDGKPLIIGRSKEAEGKDYQSFFTIRESQWPNEPQVENGWPWISFTRPQKVHYTSKGLAEIINVSASQHPNLDASMGGSAFYGATGNWGRSFRNNSPGNPQQDIKYGYNIQEQWDYAIKQNVPYIFVTGWNEWIVGKWKRGSGNQNHALFVDQANGEYSRDIEPSYSDGLEDHYYMQLISNSRKFKGTTALELLSDLKSITSWNDWNTVSPEYTDYVGDILHRNHSSGLSSPKLDYTNNSGRNDFKSMKVARDKKSIYFYVETENLITEPTQDDWMTLWINTSMQKKMGWNGYQYRIVQSDFLQEYVNNRWVDKVKVIRKTEGSKMMIQLSLKDLKLKASDINFEFKWTDNSNATEILDWYKNGDVAPNGRLNYIVKSE
ncbi:hypothetical protein [Sphingobacterium hungaricum]